MLRDWFEAGEHEDTEFSRQLLDRIVETGLEPVAPRCRCPLSTGKTSNSCAGLGSSRKTMTSVNHPEGDVTACGGDVSHSGLSEWPSGWRGACGAGAV